MKHYSLFLSSPWTQDSICLSSSERQIEGDQCRNVKSSMQRSLTHRKVNAQLGSRDSPEAMIFYWIPRMFLGSSQDSFTWFYTKFTSYRTSINRSATLASSWLHLEPISSTAGYDNSTFATHCSVYNNSHFSRDRWGFLHRPIKDPISLTLQSALPSINLELWQASNLHLSKQRHKYNKSDALLLEILLSW